MRTRALKLVVWAVLLGQGVSVPVHAGERVQLFADNGAPRFHLYLACVSKTVNCEIIQRDFDDWAGARQLDLHAVGTDDPAFAADMASAAAEQDQPYRVVVRYAPEMGLGANGLPNGGSGPPLLSYAATVRVFDAGSGKLLKTMNWRDERAVDQAGAANPYLAAQVRGFLKHLDPTYAAPAG